MPKNILGVVTLVAILLSACDSNPDLVDPESTESIGKRGSFKRWRSTTGRFDPEPAWPFCGRIDQNRPAGWVPEDGCPAERFGNPNYTDGTISSTYGPRPLVSEVYRYDFHRGIDLAAPIGTALFAVADGEVRIAGEHASYSDPLIQLRHFRPGANSCSSGDGCYHSNYLHASGWTVTAGDMVEKGDLIGYSGVSASGFEHLHFEIRDAPGPHDIYSNWSRDAVHPLTFLPYAGAADAADITIEILEVDLSEKSNPKPIIEVTIPTGDGLDLSTIAVEVYRKRRHRLVPILQVGDTPVGLTPEGTGYLVNPSSFDFTGWNRMYSYKNSTSYPWSDFECGGAFESPYCGILPGSYNADVHMDAADSSDPAVGSFNGVTIWPTHHNANSTEYKLKIRFNELTGPIRPASLCIKALAIDASANTTDWDEWGNCG